GLARGRIPVLVGQVEVAGIGGAGGEVLDDAAAEARVRVYLARRDGRGRDRDERAERAAVIGRARDVNRMRAAVRRERHDRDEKVACRVDLRVDVGDAW